MTGRQVHRSGTLVFSVLMVAIGVALIVQVLSGDGGVLSASDSTTTTRPIATIATDSSKVLPRCRPRPFIAVRSLGAR
ncbi:MAG TPA: hypothetical protein VH025_08010, partial [Solirubrobacteraceae bacterium]|nr:hypothetical protein [Solirubrobacteraceae bacterium]